MNLSIRNARTDRHNQAVMLGRLFGTDVKNRETERCGICGELLHPFPYPEYWMQYPLPECCIIDGVKVCDNYRKPECLDTYLMKYLVPTGAQMEMF